MYYGSMIFRWLKKHLEERRERRFVDKVLKYSREYELEAKKARFGESQDELVLKFFRGVEDERIPRTVDQVEAFSDDDMEMYHDFIQWVYPTIQPSNLHPDAPVISEKFADMLSADKCALHNYCRTCRRYLKYLNFKCEGDGEVLLCAGKDATPEEHAKDFYQLPGHNYLRITRALNSLRETGHLKCSRRLYAALLHSLKYAPKQWVSKVTLEYWKDTQKQE